MTPGIPIHDFTKDNKDSVPFKFIPLNAPSDYDTSFAHRHNYYEIFFFSRGGGQHLIDFNRFNIIDHSIHFVSPGQVHLIKREPGSLGSIVVFSRDLYYLGSETKDTLFNFPFLNNGAAPVLSLTAAEYEQFIPLLDMVRFEYCRNDAVHIEMVRSYLNIILLKCARLNDTKNPGWRQEVGSQFSKFRLLMENEYRKHKLPAYYAGRLNITEKKLNKLCIDASGLNIGTFIKERVLLEARRLLFNTDHSIKEIAYFLGYDDASYFVRLFKSKTGVTPGDFRATWQKVP